MVEANTAKAQDMDNGAEILPDSRRRISALKYFIHDSVEAFRFQLVGSLSEVDVSELNGCWRTAKTTLGNRKLVLDLRDLHSTDEAGKEWLLAMALDGAVYLPDSYFRTNLTGQPSGGNYTAKKSVGFFGRLFSSCRSSRVIPAASSTQAQ